MHDSKWYIAVFVTVIVLLISVWVKAQPPRTPKQMEFVPFETFYDQTQRATFGTYAMKTEGGVDSYDEFVKMQDHILSMYEGVYVKNSFALGSDYIDCMDINTQPGLKRNGKQSAVAKPPPPARVDNEWESRVGATHPAVPVLSEHKKDAYGNVQFCEKGFVPTRRITLDEVTRYHTLSDFFNKYGHAGEKGIP